MVTNRLAEGLPFVPNKFINALLYGALARASALNPRIIICGFTFLQNHYHLIVLIESDEKEMESFLHDLDDELARIVKTLLGKRNLKVWAQRPHVAVLGDAETVIIQLAYCFLNPIKANFCEKAADWIGVNSFRFLFNQTPENHKWLRTRKLAALPNTAFNRKLTKRLYQRWYNLPGKIYQLNVAPFAWKGRFHEMCKLSDEEIRSKILDKLADEEIKCRKVRNQLKQEIADPEQLAQQNPHKYYKPKKFGRRVYCICSDPELRKQMIELYQSFCETCAAVWAAWKRGDFTVKYPPGAFIPPRSPLCSAIPEFS
jgi:hypothetical protein